MVDLDRVATMLRVSAHQLHNTQKGATKGREFLRAFRADREILVEGADFGRREAGAFDV